MVVQVHLTLLVLPHKAVDQIGQVLELVVLAVLFCVVQVEAVVKVVVAPHFICVPAGRALVVAVAVIQVLAGKVLIKI